MRADTFFSWFPVFFITMWCGVCFLLSRLSGWASLAEYFRLKQPFSGERKHFRSGMVGWVGYRSCLTVGVNREGLYLAVMPIFALGSPPLFIPWKSVTSIKKQKRFFFMQEGALEIGNPTITTACIPWRFIDTARHYFDPKLIRE